MDIFERLDRLEDYIVNSKHVPFSSSIMVNENDVFEIIDEMRNVLPDEIKQAKWMIKEKDEIIQQAKREAEQQIQKAQEERERLVSDDEITRDARERADRIIQEANSRSREIKNEAEYYADERLAALENTCFTLLKVIRQARERLQGPGEQNQGPGISMDDLGK